MMTNQSTTNQLNMWNTTLYECNCPERNSRPQRSCTHMRALRRQTGPSYAFWSSFYIPPTELVRQQAVYVPNQIPNSVEIVPRQCDEETKEEN